MIKIQLQQRGKILAQVLRESAVQIIEGEINENGIGKIQLLRNRSLKLIVVQTDPTCG